MDWITDQVAIGNYMDAQDIALLRENAFRSVLSLDGTLWTEQAAEFGLAQVVSYRLIDGVGNDPHVLRLAIQDLCRLAEEKYPVLVQCHAGRSRSGVVVAGYLMRQRSIEPEEAIAAIAARREINITPALIELLCRLDG